MYHLAATIRETRFTDDWLKTGATYYYRVAAVGAETRQGVVSDAAPGATQANRKSPPAKVGAAYTGLISDPRAWRGDKPDTLYLQWRRNTDSDVRYYELFRSETADSELAENTLLATVQPGSYVVVPFEERGLKPDTPYYYRVRAVDRDGRKGQPSDVCRGVTHEP